MMRWMGRIGLGLAVLLVLGIGSGCETSTNEGEITLAQLQGLPDFVADEDLSTGQPDSSGSGSVSDGGAAGGWPSEINGPIKWLHTDVSKWSVTASLKASVGGGTINMPYSKARTWPNNGGVNANCWAIVNIGGQWYAATFEYLRPGQQAKPVGVLDGGKGDHFKVSPLNQWRPRSGERFGIMVSGLARSSSRNVQERSNVSMVTWP